MKNSSRDCIRLEPDAQVFEWHVYVNNIVERAVNNHRYDPVSAALKDTTIHREIPSVTSRACVHHNTLAIGMDRAPAEPTLNLARDFSPEFSGRTLEGATPMNRSWGLYSINSGWNVILIHVQASIVGPNIQAIIGLVMKVGRPSTTCRCSRYNAISCVMTAQLSSCNLLDSQPLWFRSICHHHSKTSNISVAYK